MDKLKVIYEDNHIIVVEKQPGIISQANGKDKSDMLSLVKEYVKRKYSKPGEVFLGLVHRLDKPVGGVMVFARTSKAASRLSEQMRSGNINKTYLAIVNGRFKFSSGSLEGYMLKDRDRNISKMCEENERGSKYAALKYEVISEKDDYSLLRIELLTGRSHQIRVQLADAGNPVVGDRKYGHDISHDTVALWAYKLCFVHPVEREPLSYISVPKADGVWKKFNYKGIESEK